MPLIKCECGCGTEFEQLDRYGRKRRFFHGHNRLAKFASVADSFWAKAIKTELGCWRWSGAKATAGYGSFTFRTKRYSAHVVSFEIHKGRVPSGMCVRHTCDNPECTNPSHLEIGTHTDNMHDMIKRGRSLTQKKCFSEQDISKMRDLFYARNLNQYEIADIFNTDQSYISRIVRYERRGHVSTF